RQSGLPGSAVMPISTAPSPPVITESSMRTSVLARARRFESVRASALLVLFLLVLFLLLALLLGLFCGLVLFLLAHDVAVAVHDDFPVLPAALHVGFVDDLAVALFLIDGLDGLAVGFAGQRGLHCGRDLAELHLDFVSFFALFVVLMHVAATHAH